MRYPALLWTSLAFLIAPLRSAEMSTPPARPNILWLVCEDFTANYSGPYGDPLARTPAIDGLARRGVTFERAYAPAPVCAPARSSIITGRYASSLGTEHMRSTRPLPDSVRFFPEYLRQAGYFCTNNAKTDYNTSTSWSSAWDENGRNAHWRHRKPGQPFFAVFNFEQSHESRLHKRVELITDPAKVRVPEYLPDTPNVRADIAQYYDCVSRADEALATVLAQLRADGLEDNTIVFCYSDNGGATPRSKRFLYENGTHVALVVHVPPALRQFAPGEPGSRSRELVNFVDFAPTVLSLAGVNRGRNQFAGRVLFGPEREPAPQYTFMFRDRMDEVYDLARAVTDGRYRYIRNYYPALPWGRYLSFLWQQASMREWAKLAQAGRLNAAQRAFFEPKPAEELYDCETDPDNVRNLAGDPAHAANLARLRAALRSHLLAIRDCGFMPEPMLVARANGRSPTEVTADDREYPLARILDALDELQIGARTTAAPGAHLASPDPLVRYWALVSAWPAAKEFPFSKWQNDVEPLVQLAAAEGMLRAGPPTPKSEAALSAGWDIVERFMREERAAELQLYALNVVSRVPLPLPERLRPRLEHMAKTTDGAGSENYVARAARALLAGNR